MRAIFGVAVCMLWALFAGAAGAQQRAPAQGNELPERDLLNAGTVTVITAPIGGPMSIMGSDMASVLDDGDKLRVLPILGKGSVQNLIDILRLKNIDMGFVTHRRAGVCKGRIQHSRHPQARPVHRPSVPQRHSHRGAEGDPEPAGSAGKEDIRRTEHRISGGAHHLPPHGHRGGHRFADRSRRRPAKAARRRAGRMDRERFEGRPGHQEYQERGREIPSAGDSLREAVAGYLSAVVFLVRRISKPRGERHQGLCPCRSNRADGVQLATRERALPEGRAVRRCVVRQDRAIAAASTSSEMERHRNIDQRRRAGTFQARSGLARQSPAGGGSTQPGPTAATAEEFRSFLVQKNGRENVSQQDTAKAYNDFLRWRAGQK